MTTETRRPAATCSSIFQWRSLKTRVALFTLTFFLAGIWSLAIYASFTLQNDMENALGEQQFSIVSIMAAALNNEIMNRMSALEKAAKSITPTILGNTASMQTLLEERPIIATMFSSGVYVTRLDGTVIADVPVSSGRTGVNYLDRDYIIEALKGKTTISRPVKGKITGAPRVVMSTPIRDSKGKVIGVLAGGTDLGQPNFLDEVTNSRYGRTGGLLVVAPQHRLIIAATDRRLTMSKVSDPGTDPLIDRFIQGYEGSGVLVNPVGVEVLASAKRIPIAGWYMAAALPTEEAFAPIRTMQQQMLLAAAILSLLAACLIWWMLKRQLEPVFATIKTLATRSDASQPLPVTRQDEIGELIGGFNGLLEKLGQREEALKESEAWHRTLMQTSMDGFWLADVQGHLLEVNETYSRMSGYSVPELLAMSIPDLEVFENTEKIAAHIRQITAQGADRFESQHRRKDGTIFDVEISVQFRPHDGGRFVVFLRDITGRKRAEEGLRESNELFSLFMRHSPIYVYLKEVTPNQSRVLHASDNYVQMIGVRGNDMIGKTMPELFPNEFAAQITADDWAVTSRGDVLRLDEELNGRSYTSIKFPIIRGDRTLLAGYTIDITERKKAEESLRVMTERLRLATSSAKAGVWDWNLEKNEMTWDDRMLELYGLTHENFPGGVEAWEQGLHPDDSSRAIEACQAALRGERDFDTEFRVRRPDGTVIHIKANGLVLRDEQGNPLRMIGLNIDVTERMRAEEIERQNRETAEQLARELSIVAEIGRIVGSTLDIDMVYDRFAAEAKKLIIYDRLAINLHYSSEENVKVAYVSGADLPGRNKGDFFPMQGSTTAFLARTRAGLLDYPEDAEGLNAHVPIHHDLVHRGMGSLLRVPLIYRDEVIGSLHFGSKIPNTYSEKELHMAERIGAQIAGAIGSAKLFSDHKQAEQEKRNLEERLQRSEKMEALGQLAGGVAHDLNNVLGVSTIYSELLQEQLPEGSPLRKYADSNLSAMQKAAAIIEDLLSLARRSVVVSEVMNLNRVVSDFLKNPVFQKIKDFHPQVTFRTAIDSELLNMKGSPVHLEKVAMNLISNAADAISGKGAVTIRTDNRYLDKPIEGYAAVREGDYAVLTVSDTGIGIAAENMGKIFEPFYTKKAMGRSGTGLGLAIVWGTVKDHDGYIDVKSTEGEGTTFTLYFPVTREEATEAAAKIPIEQYMGRGESLLVVDDVAEQRQVAMVILTKLGYQVNSLAGGEEAVEYLKSNKADLIVLDMIMDPGIDGLETFRRVRQINPTQKAILVSGFSETDRVKDALTLGAGAYVKKPYIMEKIGVAVRDELHR